MAPWRCTACTFLNEDELLVACEMCLTLRAVLCTKCRREIGNGARVVAADRPYHRECFRCAACHEYFSTPQFQLKDDEPYHLECYKTLFLPVCEVCERHIPTNASGNVVFKMVPFWGMRYSDPRRHFEQLSDGRKTCHDCCLTVILDTDEPVVRDVWQFMESLGINLPVVPTYLVEYSVLNEHQQHATHSHGNTSTNGFVTRGLCLSEVTELRHLVRRGRHHVPQVVHLQKVSLACLSATSSVVLIAKSVCVSQNRSVNAILILHGLPYDLTAQVLAHEATHAYIKLNDGFPDHLAPMVEEGVCQLISYLWLQYKQVLSETEEVEASAGFARKLRAFYVQQIETDPSPVYGDGFRRAFDAYNRTHSLQRIFDSIRQFGCFP
ncbi:hypothetical protein ATCC90586_006691 [Pythium insidiosum]|nr:hypothetical protein ATCC90586_006691 [Pythium insidiosum]